MAIRTGATPRASSTSRSTATSCKGDWHLVRMRKRPGERQEPWLLIKAKDEAARGPNDPDILEEKDRVGGEPPHDRGHRQGGRCGVAIQSQRRAITSRP